MMTLLRFPDARQAILEDPTRIDRTIEEVLRYEAPVDRQTRLALEDFDIDGRVVRSGQRIYCLLAAANRDPEVFEDPDRFDISRWPNRHLGFGYGVHFCLGAYLARLEAKTAVLEMLQRYPALKLAGEPRRWQGQTMRRYESIPVDLGGRAA
jgi:cytochrome P450